MTKAVDITIQIDTREKAPWTFEKELQPKGGCKTRLIGWETVGIDAADYRIKEYPDMIAIEKKSGFSEMFGNYATKEAKDRFLREMEKLRSIKYKFLLIESNLTKDVLKLSIPQFKYPIPASKIYRWTEELEMEFGIKTRFVGDAGSKVMRTILDVCVQKEL